MIKIAYLGPEGTFSEQAARCFTRTMDAEGTSLSPLASIEDVFEAVETGAAAYGVLPIENSIEGGVNATIDALIFDSDLFISKQLTLPIVQNLMISERNAGRKITNIISHPQALAQCRKFINREYPDAVIEAAASTAEAARTAARRSENGEAVAAIGPKNSADVYGLKIIQENVQDNKNNTTQFVLLTKDDTSAPKKGCNTSVVFSTRDEPGELYRVLGIFAIWNLNMTRILSRPTKNRQGEYVFFIEISECADATDVSDALTMIKRKTIFFKNLGSYQIVNV
ncbi:MAG: prephenate dehydratase [Methanomassiliicoccaceae archaeon]|nr:prephenate dehydratase [Methanomassiliicoccaceae archaeon]